MKFKSPVPSLTSKAKTMIPTVPSLVAVEAPKPAMVLTIEVQGTEAAPYKVQFGMYYGAAWPAGWSCTCQDYYWRHRETGGQCKHIKAVTTSPAGAAVMAAMIGFNK